MEDLIIGTFSLEEERRLEAVTSLWEEAHLGGGGLSGISAWREGCHHHYTSLLTAGAHCCLGEEEGSANTCYAWEASLEWREEALPGECLLSLRKCLLWEEGGGYYGNSLWEARLSDSLSGKEKSLSLKWRESLSVFVREEGRRKINAS